MRLPDKISIITGAGQGIGKGIALRLAKEGCHVVVAELNPKTAEQTALEIRKLGRESLAIPTDVTSCTSLENMVQEAISKFGRIDILVNNAGIIKANFFLDMDENIWRKIIEVNLTGVFLCSQAVARYMVIQKYGKIININSKSGKKGGTWLAAYCASKFGVIGLTQSMALDLAPYRINVNAVCPGNVFETPMWDQLDKEFAPKLGIPPEKVRAKYLEKVPLERECRMEDVANVVVFLASEETSYMTGQAINITGGQEMR